jgi:hypothetical protein
MHHAAIADRSENRRESQFVAQHVCAEIAFVEGHGIARAEEYIVKGAGIFAERGFVISSAIEIVEDGTRQAALSQAAEIFDVDDMGRAEGGSHGSHGGYFMKKVVREAIRNSGGTRGQRVL